MIIEYLTLNFISFAIIIEILLLLYMCYCIFAGKQKKAFFVFAVVILISVYCIACFRYDRTPFIVCMAADVFLFAFLSLVCQRRKTVLTIVLLFIFTLPFWAPVFIMGPFTILLISSFFAWLVVSRESVQTDVITMLGCCLKQNMPLSTALARSASGSGGKASKILFRLSEYLSEGYSLSDSIRLGYRKCPGNIAGLLQAAEDVDRLPQAAEYISQKFNSAKHNYNNSGYSFYNVILYPLFVILFICAYSFFYTAFILPPMREIYMDLHINQAIIPKLFSDFLFFMVYNGGFLVMVSLVLFIFFRCIFHVRRIGKLSVISRLGDVIKWYLPGVNWFVRTDCNTRMVAYIRMALAADVPMDRIVNNCCNLGLNIMFNRKVKKWYDLLVNGVPVVKAAKQAGIARPVIWCFDADNGSCNVPEALEMLEKSYSSVLSFRVNLAKEIAGPVLILFCSALTGLLCYTIFKPMVMMIYAVM